MFLKSQPVPWRVGALQKGGGGEAGGIFFFPVKNETTLPILKAMSTLLSTTGACE